MPRKKLGMATLISTTLEATKKDRLNLHDMAVLRADIEGADVDRITKHYLPLFEATDTLSYIKELREVFIRLASIQFGTSLKRTRLLLSRITVPDKRSKSKIPTLDQFIEENSLEDFTEQEAIEQYRVAYSLSQPKVEKDRSRIRRRQRMLLERIEKEIVRDPALSDPIQSWLPGVTLLKRLNDSGFFTLYDLHIAESKGGRWWAPISGFGPGKAKQLKSWLDAMVPDRHQRTPQGPVAKGLIPEAAEDDGQSRAPNSIALPSPVNGQELTIIENGQAQVPNTLPSARGYQGLSRDYSALPFSCDPDAIEAWIRATAGALVTAKTYRKEAMRYLLWLRQVKAKTLHDVTPDDCREYITFLTHIPDAWINKGVERVYDAEGWMPGEVWRPFRKQISAASRQQSIIILYSMAKWLADAEYVPRNPWHLVNRKIKEDENADLFATRAFSKEAWARIHEYMDRQTPSPTLARTRFVLSFVEATGVRASELVGATTKTIRIHNGHLAMQIHGKGSKNRIIALPSQAVRSLEEYFIFRGLSFHDSYGKDVPFIVGNHLASIQKLEAPSPIGYSALYASLKKFFRSVSSDKDTPPSLYQELQQGSTHWLRHTFGTRALERGAPLDVIQRQLGHADPRTTMRYSKAQIDRLTESLEGVFGSGNQ